ncbi:RGS domain-containing protein [Naegleria gruberi]|uniref:RGS domain-containing protein n=1 Tax=Naegleria gruberi TaxID=5762 RepID=D2V6E2_NAEGR|nr:RGS domain-containing protein [Naegleria gruberi]EFC47555.1 RGS domain-containing protein [Naegleria gruberi]|eukprot:XP_002680299.1 RGS domain-containing protein [Naegleria gruberi strain NEG-M]
MNNTTSTSSQIGSPSDKPHSPITSGSHLNLPPNQISTQVSNKKVVTIASPTTTKPTVTQSQVNLVNPSESGRSGSSFSQSKITLRTCCGVVELTSMKLACLLGMMVTVVGLVVLAAVAIAAFITASSKSTDILIAVGKVTSLFESSNSLVLKYTFVGAAADLSMYNSYQFNYKNSTQEMKTLLQTILRNLDDASIQKTFNSTSIEASNTLDSLNSQTMIMVFQDQKADAQAKISSDSYNTILKTFEGGLDQLVSFVQTKEKEKDTQVLAITLVQLVVIVVSLFVILPIIVFVFTYAINRDSLYLDKIRRANAIMLMDTMEDDGLRALFKIHCEKEKSVENYLLLEKIQYFRSLCERSLDLQMRLFGDNNVLSDISSDISGDSAQSSKKKKESPLEKEYAEVEAKKYEVAFEIFTEFLEVTGDMAVNISHVLVDAVKDKLDKFNDKQIETLPEDMFNILEKETCLVMMDTHHRFKQSLAFQREMKIDKIKVDKLKKKKVDF